MKFSSIKNKGFNEIYFVLYLTVLLLILPDNSTKKTENVKFEQLENFYLKSEKNSLNIRFYADTSGVEILSADTVNFIYPIGPNIESIDYDIVIKSENINRSIFSSAQKENIPGFNIEKQENNVLKFTWKPEDLKFINDNYSIEVEALVKAKDRNSLVRVSNKFNLNKYIVNRVPINLAVNNDQNEVGLDQQNRITFSEQSINSNTFDVDLFPNAIYKFKALSRFQVKIDAYGGNLKQWLKEKPTITNLKGIENVDIIEITNSSIILSGQTPSYGKASFDINIVGRYKNITKTHQINIAPLPIGFAEYPKVIYPYLEYEINPNLPNLSDKNIRAEFYIQDKLIHFSENGTKFKIVIEASDTNKKAYLKRFLNNELIEQAESISIRPYPKPEIIKFNKDDEFVYIRTRSFGLFSNSQRNYVKSIMINGQSVNAIDMSGSTEFQGDESTIQVFKLNDISDKDDIKVIDSYGNSSESKVYRN